MFYERKIRNGWGRRGIRSYHLQSIGFFVDTVDTFASRVENLLLAKIEILFQLGQSTGFVLVELIDESDSGVFSR